MKIKRLYINNYKSLVDFELLEPNPFSVFVGPNAAGKSNVFEALEFLTYSNDFARASKFFGGVPSLLNKTLLHKYRDEKNISFQVKILLSAEIPDTKDNIDLLANLRYQKLSEKIEIDSTNARPLLHPEPGEFSFELKKKEDLYNDLFSRIFIKNRDLVKINTNGSEKLRIDVANLESVLHRILQDDVKREEISEWVEYLIPNLEKLDVIKNDLSGEYTLRIFEKSFPDPIGKHLISDGTYNILALLTAVYQSDESQFICIEEPENGITPYVQRALVKYFRTVCEEKGHYIWLNTHSPTIVNELEPKELILIDKIEGITKAKQLDPNLKLVEMKLDDAWLTNTLGGGLPW